MNTCLNIQINRNSRLPVYEQIARSILDGIQNGSIKPGEKLPAERHLAESLNVSRGTVKKAYANLAQSNAVKLVQGSGCYALNNWTGIEGAGKKEAYEALSQALFKARSLGLTDREIKNLINIYLASDTGGKTVNIAIVANNQEALLDYKNQLSYLANVSVSIFSTDSVTINPKSEHLLSGYDIILTSLEEYDDVRTALGNLSHRIIKAAVAPGRQTLMSLLALDRSCKIGIIARTHVFLATVKATLVSMGFQAENLLSYFEADYTTRTYFPQKIHGLVTFPQASIFTDPAFEFRNEELLKRGGKLIKFEYQLERGTLVYIEDKVQELLLREFE